MPGPLLGRDPLWFDSCKRPPSLCILGGCLQEVLLYVVWFSMSSYGNCEAMESWKIRILVPKALESCENFGNQTWAIKECGKTRKELGPKRVPQLFLGSLQGTRRSAIGQLFSLFLVTSQKSLRTLTRSSFLAFKGTGSRSSACSLIKLLFSNLLLILSVNNPTDMYLCYLRVYFKVEVYFRVT